MKKSFLMNFIIILFFVAGNLLAQYTPGTYKGSAIGRADNEHDGLVEVEVTVSESKIENIKVLTYHQSVDHKKYGALVTEAQTKIPAQIVEKQSIETDAITDATMATNAINLAVAKALAQATGSKYVPGTYKGSAFGRSDKEHDGMIEVEVTVSDSKIEKIDVLKYNQSVDHKKYGAPVTEVKNKVPTQVVEKQNLDVDVVTDATFATVALDLAVAKALEKARKK
ncbi:MAG: FMN-binding protein [Ignavibacteriae bacterium]|nr:FMN-binding protein [Ignavibacteriota bacterium]